MKFVIVFSPSVKKKNSFVEHKLGFWKKTVFVHIMTKFTPLTWTCMCKKKKKKTPSGVLQDIL